MSASGYVFSDLLQRLLFQIAGGCHRDTGSLPDIADNSMTTGYLLRNFQKMLNLIATPQTKTSTGAG